MKSRLSILFAAIFFFSLPLGAQTMSHSEHEGHDMTTTEKMDTSATMHDEMFDLGSVSEKGVMANSHLNNVTEAMANVGMPYTHHFMVMFMDEKSGDPIGEGTVAVKIRNPAGEESAPLHLEGMDGHFGADIILEQKGMYEFSVGTALIDGVKRQYQFTYEYK
ncbi:MAG: hypothetical protein K0A99_00630 [Desulfoarculaceae bacterium]|nr:hypothetical protein [Desulfoarculaceae bacterium]